MSKIHTYVFVLWGEKFEEDTAAIFVTELRKAGLRVKVVGLAPQHINGAHGLALVPDLTLDQALPLANHTTCLIVPYKSRGIKRLNNDPRVQKFFAQALANQARFVFGPVNNGDIAESGLLPKAAMDQIIVYPKCENMVEFARELADLLLDH